ncbi:hypothetical protein DD237_008315 [Peronospora effusa]|uniref:Uncharacterized protein n=1 Tax=Peronospora effusa TaxID=542832 RepID=A0A425C4E3_9STRA|nr:hypothetical protein DD237_008315 [Peronospora effusa]
MMMKRLYQIATRDYPLREDAALRQMSVEEMRGTYSLHVAKRLELPGCLMFLVCTTSELQSAAMMAYIYHNVEGVLMLMSQHRRSLVRKLVGANARSDATKEVMEQFMRAAKRVRRMTGEQEDQAEELYIKLQRAANIIPGARFSLQVARHTPYES